MSNPYYTFNQYLKKRFGKRVYKICIDAGFTCPNRNGSKGTEGCIYCNNNAFTTIKRTPPSYCLPPIEKQINEGKAKLSVRYKAEAFLLYFQPYSNTYAPLNQLRKLYDYVYSDKDIVGISIGTRPDCVNEEIINLISTYSKDKEAWIEYGLESTHDTTLQIINRQHSVQDFINAIDLTKKHNIKICVHLIFGLPYETYKDMLETVKFISKLPIHAVKFHPLHIVKGSLLYEKGWLENNKWVAKIPKIIYKNISAITLPKNIIQNENELIIQVKLLSMQEYANIVSDALLLLPSNVIIQRLTGEANPELLIAPDWINKKHMTLKLINQKLKKN